jgi:hypothetical protein
LANFYQSAVAVLVVVAVLVPQVMYPQLTLNFTNSME